MASLRYTRPPSLVAIARGSSYLFIVEGSVLVIDDVDVDALSRILSLTAQPISQSHLLEVCPAETLQTLVDLGVLVTLEAPPTPITVTTPPRRCTRLVVGLSGAVAVASALEHVLALAHVFATQVDVIITAGASHFVQPRVFDYYGLRTWTDPYEPRHGIAVPHKHLADADLILVAPTSANTIHRLASGACSDLLSLVVANTRAPVVVAPSMNAQMWAHPPIARNVAQLRQDGIWVIDPGLGFPLADHTQTLGAMGFDLPGLLRALDGVLTAAGSPSGSPSKSQS